MSVSHFVAESAFTFNGPEGELIGILHQPDTPQTLGVVIVVGGTQYRVGAHRSFVQLARAISEAGFPVLRFDHRGIGDAPAEYPGFAAIGPDISAALDVFMTRVPMIEGVMLWGLCDAVPAICQIANQDKRVQGIALINPWIRDAESYDRSLFKNYYAKRPFQSDFWKNLLLGKSSGIDFVRLMVRMAKPFKSRNGKRAGSNHLTLKERVYRDLLGFKGPCLLVLSGNDLTAQEFDQEMSRLNGGNKLASSDYLTRIDFPTADHTFTTTAERTRLVHLTRVWIDWYANNGGCATDRKQTARFFAMPCTVETVKGLPDAFEDASGGET